ncbi:MAG: hypothetical protein D6731_18720 [Planctomycetota bacterium]|nr:MAG: hypothetical protein D6731_18720 [Planctomycetota bacterium]
MSDDGLRRAERAAAGGDPAARAEALRAKVRAGALSPQRLALAAYAGDPVAALAAPEVRRPPEFLSWLLGLDRWGSEAGVRAALAATRRACAVLADDEPAPTEALACVAAWLARPCAGHAAEAQRAADRTARAWTVAAQAQRHGPTSRAQVLDVWEAALNCARAAAVEERISAAVESCLAAARAVGEAAVRAAVQDALSAWALSSPPA